jgi:chromosome segregation ATPase
MTSPGIRAVGARHANFEYFGIDPGPELASLYAEHEKLAAQFAEISEELKEAAAALKSEEGALPGKRAEALRSGESVDTSHLEGLRERVKELETRKGDLEGAAKLVERDVQEALSKEQPRLLEAIEHKRMEAAGRAQRIRQELASEEWWFDATDKLRRYLTSDYMTGGKKLTTGIGPRPEAPSDVKVDA